MVTKNYHVITRVNGGWKVVKAGSPRASKTFATKSEAIDYGRTVSRNHHSELIVHGIDGRFQRRTSFASDPMPPKDES
jgi:hypothetical protein